MDLPLNWLGNLPHLPLWHYSTRKRAFPLSEVGAFKTMNISFPTFRIKNVVTPLFTSFLCCLVSMNRAYALLFFI